MHPEIAAYASRQGGLISAAQARATGLTVDDLRPMLASGQWIRVRRGVYAIAATDDGFSTQQRRRDDAACLTLGIDHVRSHASAALVIGLPILNVPRTHITTRHTAASRRDPDLSVHIGTYSDEEVVVVDGIRSFDAPRAALDIAREYGPRHGVVALDSALRLGARSDQIGAALRRMRRWPGVRAARQAWDLADPGSESVGESLARLLVIELGHGRPETQFGLSDGRRTAYADLRLGRHLFEFDGRIKYQNGVASSPEEAVWQEKQREDWLRGFRLGMSRITWSDCIGDRSATRARLQREYDATCRAFGTSIEDLGRFRSERRMAG